jgi:hypothetical protein
VVEATSDTEGTIAVTCVSKAPFYRIAEVDADFLLNGNTAEFYFEDDGWGNTANGTITFYQNKLIIGFDYTVYADSNWGMFTDIQTFTRGY